MNTNSAAPKQPLNDQSNLVIAHVKIQGDIGLVSKRLVQTMLGIHNGLSLLINAKQIKMQTEQPKAYSRKAN